MKGKKSLINKPLLKLLMSILLLSQKMLKDKVKIILLMMIMIIWIVIPINLIFVVPCIMLNSEITLNTQHSAFRETARHNKTVITYNSTRPTTIRLPEY